MQTPFIKRWVSPFYLRILHGNYASPIVVGEERTQFNTNVLQALETITPQIAAELIGGHWREAICGSWFAGLKRFPECQSQIGELLLASQACFAGQSHVFAMACYADETSVEFLKEYLKTYLQRLDCFYDQNWAMPALMWIDQQQATNHADDFLAPNGLWGHFTAGKISEDNDAWTIKSCKSHFWQVMQYCHQHFIN